METGLPTSSGDIKVAEIICRMGIRMISPMQRISAYRRMDIKICPPLRFIQKIHSSRVLGRRLPLSWAAFPVLPFGLDLVIIEHHLSQNRRYHSHHYQCAEQERYTHRRTVTILGIAESRLPNRFDYRSPHEVVGDRVDHVRIRGDTVGSVTFQNVS